MQGRAYSEDDLREICASVLRGTTHSIFFPSKTKWHCIIFQNWTKIPFNVLIFLKNRYPDRLSELTAGLTGPPGPPGRGRVGAAGKPGPRGPIGTSAKLIENAGVVCHVLRALRTLFCFLFPCPGAGGELARFVACSAVQTTWRD